MVESALRATKGVNFALSPETYHAINSTIGEHFDNIFLHAPTAEYGTLCGFFDRKKMEITILIFNYGDTIAFNLDQENLPEEIQGEIRQIIDQHVRRSFFLGSRDFTVENAITLLAIQEASVQELNLIKVEDMD